MPMFFSGLGLPAVRLLHAASCPIPHLLTPANVPPNTISHYFKYWTCSFSITRNLIFAGKPCYGKSTNPFHQWFPNWWVPTTHQGNRKWDVPCWWPTNGCLDGIAAIIVPWGNQLEFRLAAGSVPDGIVRLHDPSGGFTPHLFLNAPGSQQLNGCCGAPEAHSPLLLLFSQQLSGFQKILTVV